METTKLKIADGNGFVEIDMNKSSIFDVEITDADYPKVAPDYEAMCKELTEALEEIRKALAADYRGSFSCPQVGMVVKWDKKCEELLSRYRGMKP